MSHAPRQCHHQLRSRHCPRCVYSFLSVHVSSDQSLTRDLIKLQSEEAYADGFINLDAGARGCELASVCIDRKDTDIATALIGHQHVLAGWFNGKVAWCFDTVALMSLSGEQAGLGIDGKNGDRVVWIAIRYVDKLARRMHDCFSGAATIAFYIGRQRRQRLFLSQRAFFGVIITGYYRQIGFAIDVCMATVERPGKVSRACAFGCLHFAMRCQSTTGGIKLVDDDFVQAQIATQRELVRLVQMDRVTMLLGPLMLLEGRLVAQLAISQKRNAEATSARVVCSQHMLACCVDDQVTRGCALRCLRVKKGQLARLLVDREGADLGVRFVDCVQKLFVGMNGHKRWAARLNRQRRFGQRAIFDIELALINAMAATASVCSQVDSVLVLGMSYLKSAIINAQLRVRRESIGGPLTKDEGQKSISTR